MSEEKKGSEKILERLDKLETNMKTLIEANKPLQPTVSVSPSSPKDEAEAKPEHIEEKEVENALNCPECYPKWEKGVLKRYAEKLKGHETVKCKGCGLHVDKDEKKCPNCGNTEAE